MSDAKKISILTSAYNEEESVQELYNQLDKISKLYTGVYEFEVIFVDNGSEDETFQRACEIYQKDKRFKVIQLTRNFTFFGGLTCALEHATGDAAVIMCADLEDPPEVIPQFIKKWEEGYKNIYGVIKKRQGGWLRRLNSKMFYWLINKLTNNMVPQNVADFRLIDKQVYKLINSMPEQNRFLRGMFAWSGFKSIGVPFERKTRKHGKSKAFPLVALSIATKAIFSFSQIPIRLASAIGMVISLLSFFSLIFFIINYIIYPGPFKGFATILCLFLFMFGLIFIILGVIGEYISLVFEDVKKRPYYVVNEYIGLNN